MSRRVHPRALASVSVLCLVSVTPLLGAAPAAARPASVAAGRDDVTWWLARATAAQTGLAWSGTQLVATWSSGLVASSLVDVVHEPGKGLTTRPHDADSGTVGGAAHNQDVTMPDRPDGTAYLEAAAAGAPAPLSLLMSQYAVTLERPAQVAGRPVRSLVLRRAGATAARLWLDDATGLLLRREVYDSAGTTSAAMVFLDVTVAPEPVAAVSTLTHTLAARPGGVDAIRRSGWVCPARIGSGLVLSDARMLSATTGGTPIMHLTYSDGLRSLSVFEQRGTLDPAAVREYAVTGVGSHRVHVRQGLPTQAVWQSGTTVVTVVSDEPAGQLVDVVAAMPPAVSPARTRAGWMGTAAGAVLRAARWLTPLR